MTPEQEDAIVKRMFELNPSTEDAIRLAIRAAVAQESQWREAVLNELIVAHIYTKEHDTNPRKAIQDAITWNCQVALDPAVSSDARKLISQERERCAKIVGTYQVPVGNSPAGELACDWTMDALREIAAAIRRG